MPHPDRLRVLIVPDKFKGTLTAPAAAGAIARGWRSARPQDALDLAPMSDGGDGFGMVIRELFHAKIQTLATVDAAHRPVRANWWWAGKTAIVESAEVIGLAKHRGIHPFKMDTFGLGAMLRAAKRKGCTRCLIGIGGSATNDGGFGLARALGWEFLDTRHKPITAWTQLHRLAVLHPPRRKNWPRELIVAADVRNPLLGARGCTRVYGPQKGLARKDFKLAEGCLRRLATIVAKQLKLDCANEPGAGAAGGLGFGLLCFLGARLQPGFELFARHAHLEGRLRRADVVITGEGAIDRSTFMGKGVGQIARECQRFDIPCLGLAGVISAQSGADRYFTQAHGLTELTTLKNARANPESWLERLAAQVANNWRQRVKSESLRRKRAAG
jgi:glycerate 2-kinase